MREVLEPKHLFVAVVAGSKYDTKIGPLTEIYKKVDNLILGGIIYNAFLCAKYSIRMKGVEESDIELAKVLVEQDKVEKKILELPMLLETIFVNAVMGMMPAFWHGTSKVDEAIDRK